MPPATNDIPKFDSKHHEVVLVSPPGSESKTWSFLDINGNGRLGGGAFEVFEGDESYSILFYLEEGSDWELISTTVSAVSADVPDEKELKKDSCNWRFPADKRIEAKVNISAWFSTENNRLCLNVDNPGKWEGKVGVLLAVHPKNNAGSAMSLCPQIVVKPQPVSGNKSS